MRQLRSVTFALPLLAAASGVAAAPKAPKVHTVTLGPVHKVPYTPAFSTPDSKDDDSSTLKIRPLFVDSRQKEWTVGELHNISDRSFAIRRALHINDALPNDPGERWVWQPASWIVVDRTTGHITALHLPDFDAAVSDAVWFRDYAAYCGTTAATSRSSKSEGAGTTASTSRSAKSEGVGTLVAVVAQAGTRKAVAQRAIGRWPQPDHAGPVCTPAKWQRLPMRATVQPTAGDPVTFDVVGATSLIEEGDNDDD